MLPLREAIEDRQIVAGFAADRAHDLGREARPLAAVAAPAIGAQVRFAP